MSARGNVIVAFPRQPVQRSAADLRRETERQRAAVFRGLCGAVLSVADELRGWNADVVHGQRWRCLSDAANRMAAETESPWKPLRESESRDFFGALYEMAGAMGHFASEFGVLAARK
jgi:hypothetical protein